MNAETHEIRATFDAQTITVYQAYDPAIANPALQQQKLVPPFLYGRMTWIKPSFLWMMYRSDWARSAGQTRILGIQILRKNWDAALTEAVLSTPEPDIYPDAKAWRAALTRSRVRVQWDPERSLRTQKLPYRSIQVGIGAALSEEYATKWITSITDMTPLVHRIQALVQAHRHDEAEALLPKIEIYPATEAMKRALGM
jgi:Domain of unknown function (DUF4291)